jgi:branched-chain amino acid transport system permease protein
MPLLLVASGLANGALYALVALGLVLIYKATRVVNFAHGEAYMLGGFCAYGLHVVLGVPYAAALVLGMAACAVVGVVVESVAYRPLIDAPETSLVLATVGMSFALKGVIGIAWGKDWMVFPPLLGTRAVTWWGIALSPQHLIVAGVGLGLMAVLALFFRLTRLGRIMRGVAENRRAASLVGIQVTRVYALIWAVGSAVGAAAGILVAPLTLLYPDMGGPMLVKAFAAAVLGGFGSLPGAVVGGLIMGVIENIAGFYVHSSVVEVSALAVIFVVLVCRPDGLFGAVAPDRV